MKKLIIISTLLLSGCAFLNDSIEAYLMKYDTNEYKIVTEIRYDAHLNKQNCQDAVQSKANAIALQNKTNFFMMFTQHLPHDRDIQTASVELDKMAKGLVDRYNSGQPVSAVFCKIKFENIEQNAETIQKSTGSKPR